MANQEKLSYINPLSSPQTSVFTMHLREENTDELSSNKENNNKLFVLLRHTPGTFSQALIAAAYINIFKTTKDLICRIFQHKISKEGQYPILKT